MVGVAGGPVIRAVVLDVDGTVLRSDHTISPATREAVADVIGLGVPVILASSRSPRGLAPVQAELGISGQCLVAFQGALTGRLIGRDADDFEVLDELPMELPRARNIALMASAVGYRVNWYAGMSWFVDRVDDRVRREATITGEGPTESPRRVRRLHVDRKLCY
jgi:hydroxymethylpyrimidine pyrophosphatase-like HAD family hydrolase